MMSPQREMVTDGALMSYGQSYTEFYRQAATFVDKIMHGAKPADLPVRATDQIRICDQSQAAKALGLEMPLKLHAFADEVIE